MKAVILIGGEGTRLRPLTYLTPKPMLPLANRPFMENFISWLRYHGIKDIFFSAGYLSEKFKNYFGDGTRFGVRITFVEEKEPLDTCGGVKNVGKYLGDDSFFVFNGDILSSLNLTAMAAFHKEKKADITISLIPVDDPTSYGLALTDEESRVLEFLEKPGKDAIVTNLINAGVYIIEPHIMELVPEGERYSFERELFPGVLSEGYRVFGYVSDCYWLDVGTPQKYLKANQDILYKKVNFDFPSKEIMENIYIGKGTTYLEKNFVAGPVIVGNQTKIDENARIMPLSVIGDRCYLSGGTEISESVIFNDCKIGKKCFIKNSIISNNVVIDDNVIIDGCSIVGDNSRIGRGNILKNGIKIGINSIIPDGQITF